MSCSARLGEDESAPARARPLVAVVAVLLPPSRRTCGPLLPTTDTPRPCLKMEALAPRRQSWSGVATSRRSNRGGSSNDRAMRRVRRSAPDHAQDEQRRHHREIRRPLREGGKVVTTSRGVGAGRGTIGRNRPSGRTVRLGCDHSSKGGITAHPVPRRWTRVSVPLGWWGALVAPVEDEVDRKGSGTSETRAMRVMRVPRVRHRPRRRLLRRCRGVPIAIAAGIECAPLLLSTTKLTVRTRRWGRCPTRWAWLGIGGVRRISSLATYLGRGVIAP